MAAASTPGDCLSLLPLRVPSNWCLSGPSLPGSSLLPCDPPAHSSGRSTSKGVVGIFPNGLKALAHIDEELAKLIQSAAMTLQARRVRWENLSILPRSSSRVCEELGTV